jgi:xylulokinase
MNELIWMDSRGASYNAAIMKGFPMVQGYALGKLLKMVKRVGLPPLLSGIDGVGHVGFIKTQLPEVYKKTYKFLEPMDFITFRLTGKVTSTQGNVMAFMMVDNRKWGNVAYDDDLIKIIGIDKAKLPDLLPNNGIVGTLDPSIAKEMGLLPSTQVVAGSNDNMAAALGAGVANDYESAIIVGTSLYMTAFVPFKKTDLNHLILTIPSLLEDRYSIMGVQGSGGKNLEFFLGNLIFPQDQFGTGPLPDNAYEALDHMAAEAPAGSNGTMFLPWVTGTIVPAENPYARAVFFNLGMETHRRHICRSVMEGIALNNLWTKKPMEKFLGRKIESYRLSGGGARSNTFCQILADVLGVPIHAAVDPLAVSAKGTALGSFITLGYRDKGELSDLVEVRQTYNPNESNRMLYDKMLTQFVDLHKRTKPVFKALNAV